MGNGITNRVWGFTSGRNATEKLILVAKLTARTSSMVLRRVECGEQNSRTTLECLLLQYMYVTFLWLAWPWEEGELLYFTEVGVLENFS